MPSPVLSSPSELPSLPGFSQVAAVPAGSLVWTSGQVALRADGTLAGLVRPELLLEVEAVAWVAG